MQPEIKIITNKNTTKEVLGGKGAGLVWLRDKAHTVIPKFEIIPIQYSTIWQHMTKGKQKLLTNITQQINNNFTSKVSIRSGAEKSLPGLMDTILNIDVNDTKTIKKSIKEVWNSYNNVPKELKKGTSGTAIVIQEMVEGEKAGVVFPVFKGIKDPTVTFIFRYAKCGEDVVSGKTDDLGELVINSKHMYYAPLKWVFDTWTTEFYPVTNNPPEYEIVIKNDVVNFLQIRAFKLHQIERKPFLTYCKKILKLDIAQETIEVPKPTGIKYTQGFGGLWGSGILTKEPLEQNFILVANNGISLEHANTVTNKYCKGVIWKTGSPHAHLGVLCRNHEKGYALIQTDIKKLLNKEVLLFEGGLYENKYEITTKIISKTNTKINWKKFNLTDKKLFETIDSTNKSFKEFIDYKTWIITNKTKGNIYAWAKRMLYWGMLASIGEARHFKHKVIDEKEYDENDDEIIDESATDEINNILEEIENLLNYNVALTYQHDYTSTRMEIITNIKYVPLNKIAKIAYLLNDIFIDYNWSGGYGGSNWANVAWETHNLAKALINKDATKLIDTLNSLENAEHNNGTFYNKFVNARKFVHVLNDFNNINTVPEWEKYIYENC